MNPSMLGTINKRYPQEGEGVKGKRIHADMRVKHSVKN